MVLLDAAQLRYGDRVTQIFGQMVWTYDDVSPVVLDLRTSLVLGRIR
jgi:hypothetical protein